MALNYFQELLERQIIVRALKGYDLPEWIRISVGTMEQNRRCIAALREVLNTRRVERREAARETSHTIAAISSPPAKAPSL